MQIASPPPLDAAYALFLDIDGTLLEHQSHPEGVRVDDELRALLIATERRLGGAVAFITGRSIDMVDRLFLPLQWPVAGIYGIEHRLTPGGEAEIADEPEDVAAVAEALREELENVQGVYFEHKGPVLALHTRAAPQALELVKAAAERALPRLSAGYRIVAGHAGLEFLPTKALKSAAIRRFMDSPPFAGRRPVFIGDDVSDESGFEHVNEVGGVSIRVRPNGRTAARYAIEDVRGVRRWIAGSRPSIGDAEPERVASG